MLSLKKEKQGKQEKDEKGAAEDFSTMAVADVTQKKKDLENLLASLEDQHRKASISDAAYKEAKDKNQKRLDALKAYLRDMGMGDVADAPPEPLQPAPAQPDLAGAPSAVPGGAPPSLPAAPGSGGSGGGNSALAVALNAAQLELLETKLKMEMEKTKGGIESLKESRGALDEKIQRLAESIGEIRSLVYQREATYKDQDIKLEKIEEEMKVLKPSAIEKEFSKRDKTLSNTDIRLEKLESKSEAIVKSLGDIQALLKTMGSIDNMVQLNKDLALKVQSIMDTGKRMDRLSEKVEKQYVDLSKRLEEFIIYKDRQETLDQFSKELMRMVNELSVKSDGFVRADDLGRMQGDLLGIQGKMDQLRKTIDSVLPIIQLNTPAPIRNLQKEKEATEALIVSLKSSLDAGKLKQEDYDRALGRNLKRLRKIEAQMSEEWKRLMPAPAGAPEPEGKAAAPEKPASPPPASAPAKPEKPALVKELDQLPTASPDTDPARPQPRRGRPPAEKPADQKPPAEKPATEEPPAEKPATEEPPAEKPAAGQPAVAISEPLAKTGEAVHQSPAAEKPETAPQPGKADALPAPIQAAASVASVASVAAASAAPVPPTTPLLSPAMAAADPAPSPVQEQQGSSPLPAGARTAGTGAEAAVPAGTIAVGRALPAGEDAAEGTGAGASLQISAAGLAAPATTPEKQKDSSPVFAGRGAMVRHLEETFKKGLLSKAAFERARSLLEGKAGGGAKEREAAATENGSPSPEAR